MLISLVLALATDGTIGDKYKMPWHLPSDLARFKKITEGGTVIMGRKTWDSLPEKSRPLPGRQNIVLTRSEHDSIRRSGGLSVESVHHALIFSDHPDHTFVIGGAEIYKLFQPRAKRTYLTRVYGTFNGDTKLLETDLCPNGEHWIQASKPKIPHAVRGRHHEKDSHESDFHTFVRI